LQRVMLGPANRRDRFVDVACCLAAAGLGALFLSPALRDAATPLPTAELVADIGCGGLACLALWWRRRWPLGVAIVCVLLGTVSMSATAAGLLALFSLAVHRPLRPVLVALALWVPCVVVFAVYSPTTDPVSAVLVTTPLALAAIAWGMFVRARRQLLLTLRERAFRAEADQRLYEETARMAERTRIAREMHDVLAHRILELVPTPFGPMSPHPGSTETLQRSRLAAPAPESRLNSSVTRACPRSRRDLCEPSG